MPISPAFMNRSLLGSGGLALSDEDYAQVVAGLGYDPYDWMSSSGVLQHALGWSVHRFLERRRNAGLLPQPSSWLLHRQAWQEARIKVPHARVIVESGEVTAGGPDIADVVRVLAHSAVNAASLFIDRSSPQADFRWQWPLRIGASTEDFEALDLAGLRDDWPARSLTVPTVLTREAARVEVLIFRTDVRGALARILTLNHRVRAGFLLLLGPLDIGWRALRPQVEALLAETQAGGLAVITAQKDPGIRSLVNRWVRELSHNFPLDVALAVIAPLAHSLLVLDRHLIDAAALPVAARAIGRRLQQLPPTVGLNVPQATPGRIGLSWTHAQPPAMLGAELEKRAADGILPFDAESQGGSAVAEIGSAERETERELAHSESARYLQGNVSSYADGTAKLETRWLVVGVRYSLDVFIGEPGLGALTADRRFPDEELTWPDGEPITLQVIFAEPQLGEPLHGTLVLPRSGVSSTCRFVFTPTEAALFMGRVTLYYRGRILQTALLETTVLPDTTDIAVPPPGVEGMRLRIEAEVRRSLRTLHERRRFDVCVVCNHTATRQATLTAAGKDGAYIASLGTVGTPIAKINELLTEVANDTRTYSKGLTTEGNAKLLRDLARQGNALYRSIVIDYIQRSSAAAQVQSAEYLQIVTMQPESIVPLEFVYDYPLPPDGAAVCPNARDALKEGACPASCRPTRSPALHVCPMGFWGLSKVIERHLHVPELAKAAKVVPGQRSEPITGRDELSLKGGTLLAMSAEIPTKKNTKLDKAVRSFRRGVVATVADWPGWQGEIHNTKPILLIALPHADGYGANITLEIGGNTLDSALIDRSYVHDDSTPPPLAMLLGCDTANTANTDAYLRHVDVFRQADAALVLGTVATVLGADAADVAERLLARLTDIARRKPARFGEILRDTKRAAVADSLMIALALVAFGDADWMLTS